MESLPRISREMRTQDAMDWPLRALGDTMATIHEFRPSSRTGKSILPAGAQIIIFPGVRYERLTDTPAQPKRRRKPRVKRDHLRIKA